jgi:LmbE family N-acetylglucosaminyl deacetylase
MTDTDRIKTLGTILIVGAHPDDESYMAAGLMALAAQNGQQVICLTATKGEKGIQDAKRWPPEQLGAIRAQELQAALKILGVKQQHWLGYGDGACTAVPTAEAAAKIRAYLDQYQPDTIITFGPEGLTGHDDHCCVSAWVDQAAADRKVAIYHAVQLRELYDEVRAADDAFNIFFNIAEPPLVREADCDLVLHLSPDLLTKKYDALAAMPSQMEAMFQTMGQAKIRKMFSAEAFRRAK